MQKSELLKSSWAVVVAQWPEQLLAIPDDPGLNPAINIFKRENWFSLEKMKNKEKDAWNGPFRNLLKIRIS